MENELLHYGVPGMKWGQRKQVAPTGDVRTGKREYSEDYLLEERALKNQLKAEKMRNRTERGKNKAKKALMVLGGVGVAAAGVALLRLAKKKGPLVKVDNSVNKNLRTIDYKYNSDNKYLNKSTNIVGNTLTRIRDIIDNRDYSSKTGATTVKFGNEQKASTKVTQILGNFTQNMIKAGGSINA